MYYLFIDNYVYFFTGTVVLYYNLAVWSFFPSSPQRFQLMDRFIAGTFITALSQGWLLPYKYNAWGFATVVAIGCRRCVHLWSWSTPSSLDFDQSVLYNEYCFEYFTLQKCISIDSLRQFTSLSLHYGGIFHSSIFILAEVG